MASDFVAAVLCPPPARTYCILILIILVYLTTQIFVYVIRMINVRIEFVIYFAITKVCPVQTENI
jgi:hypothetical protein